MNVDNNEQITVLSAGNMGSAISVLSHRFDPSVPKSGGSGH